MVSESFCIWSESFWYQEGPMQLELGAGGWELEAGCWFVRLDFHLVEIMLNNMRAIAGKGATFYGRWWGTRRWREDEKAHFASAVHLPKTLQLAGPPWWKGRIHWRGKFRVCKFFIGAWWALYCTSNSLYVQLVSMNNTYDTYLQIPVAHGRMISIVDNSEGCGEKKWFQWTEILTNALGFQIFL